ncbi:hypothetical protein HD554DRAFT_2170419 [Boletus coccyginus]|nr:hypothetical protein HD554DRAFT_2170419 [Boletus coccyginus]
MVGRIYCRTTGHSALRALFIYLIYYIEARLGFLFNPPVTNGLHAVTDSIDLPSPHPLLPSLLDAGFNHEIAASVSEVYQLRAEELKRRMQKSIITACREITGLPVAALALSPDDFMRRLVSISTERYLRRLEQWKEQIIQRVNQVPRTPTKAASRNSRTFNQEYVPLLEHFFEEDPFLTHADKMFLAKKSNMEYRQIHVWFQNRRSRTKKEGKELKKKPTYEQAMKPLEKLYERMKGHMVGSDSQDPTLSKGGFIGGVTQNNTSDDAFVSSSPSHAFPSSYPPTCDYDPFPCKTGPVCFSKPEWRRVPDGKLPLSLSTNIDDLVERFSHLNVRDEARPRGSPKLRSHAATAAFTVIPSCAPHPSLMVRKYSQPFHLKARHTGALSPTQQERALWEAEDCSVTTTFPRPNTEHPPRYHAFRQLLDVFFLALLAFPRL